MSPDDASVCAREFGRRFWLAHALWPVLIWLAGVLVFACTDLDLWASDLCYDFGLGRWRWRRVAWVHTWGHDRGRVLVVGFGVVCAGVVALAPCWPGLRRYRRACLYLLACMLATTLTIAWIKRWTRHPYPTDFQRYGGPVAYYRLFEARPANAGQRLGFPAAHAGSAMALCALYFVARVLGKPRPSLWLLPSLLLGGAFAAVQQVRGQHFLSHNWWSAGIAWAWAVALYAALYARRTAPRGC